MPSLRKSDHPDMPLSERSERIFNASGLWYFRTREHADVGPFRYEWEARQMLEQFILTALAAEDSARLEAEMESAKPHFRLVAIASMAAQAQA